MGNSLVLIIWDLAVAPVPILNCHQLRWWREKQVNIAKLQSYHFPPFPRDDLQCHRYARGTMSPPGGSMRNV